MLNELEEKLLILARRRPPGLFFFRRNFRFRNFGDELSPVLVAAILRHKFPSAKWSLQHKSRNMLAIGSIMHFAKDFDVIWGTGINGKALENSYKFNSLDVRSVRGPRTWQFLLDMGIRSPKIFGDPALLAPKFLKRPRVYNKIRDFIVIPHYHDLNAFEGVDNLISPLQPLQTVLSDILSSKKVISSSLHGVILAEAYGIPAVLVLPNLEEEKYLKYLDYYEGTLRGYIDVASNFDEAIKMKGSRLPGKFSIAKLEAAFPSDFYTE
jgi:pyruvyltransferase